MSTHADVELPGLILRAVHQWRRSPITALLVRWLLPAVGQMVDRIDVLVLDDQCRAATPTK